MTKQYQAGDRRIALCEQTGQLVEQEMLSSGEWLCLHDDEDTSQFGMCEQALERIENNFTPDQITGE